MKLRSNHLYSIHSSRSLHGGWRRTAGLLMLLLRESVLSITAGQEAQASAGWPWGYQRTRRARRKGQHTASDDGCVSQCRLCPPTPVSCGHCNGPTGGSTGENAHWAIPLPRHRPSHDRPAQRLWALLPDLQNRARVHVCRLKPTSCAVTCSAVTDTERPRLPRQCTQGQLSMSEGQRRTEEGKLRNVTLHDNGVSSHDTEHPPFG